LSWFSSRGETVVEDPDEAKRCPQLVLGPGPKIQNDDPFFYLVGEFHRAIKTAKVCVVIGYGWRDNHVSERIDVRREAGWLEVIHASPSNWGMWHGDGTWQRMSQRGYTELIGTAKDLLESPTLRDRIRSVLR
jgi:hypothetical protein